MPSRFYYDDINNSTFLNTLYSADLALENHFANMLFSGDTTRMVYSSNEFAFRKRVGKSENNYSNADLPFMNYWNTQAINPDTDRFYWNHIAQMQGIFSEVVGRKIRVVPQKIEYESSVWFNNAFDLQYAMSVLSNDDSNETIVSSSVSTHDGKEVEIPLYLGYSFSTNEYKEDDWLERNHIYNQGVDFYVDAMFIFDDQGPVSITDEVILNFIASKGLNTDDPLLSTTQVLLQYFES